MRKILTMALAAASLTMLAPTGVPSAQAQVYVEGGVYYDPYDRYDRFRYDRYDRYDSRYRYQRYYPRREYRRGRAWSRHVRRCLRAYRSYDPYSDTYVNRWGYRVRCRL